MIYIKPTNKIRKFFIFTRDLMQPSFTFVKNMKLRIGILGGTFHPPHAGHVFISSDAIERFNLDYVFWIVSLKNPLKIEEPPPIYDRIETCKRIIDNENIIVSNLAAEINSNKTIDIVNFLLNNYGQSEYYWMMGSDNLVKFDEWNQWKELLDKIKIIVYDRPGYLYEDIKQKLNQNVVQHKVGVEAFLESSAPCWTLVKAGPPNVSSTEIRKNNNGNETK